MASRQFLSLPLVQTLIPVTFAYSLSSEAVVMRELRRWRRLWRRSLPCSHSRTSMWPSRSCWNGTTITLQSDEITSKGTRVSCLYYQKCPFEKSLETKLMILVPTKPTAKYSVPLKSVAVRVKRWSIRNMRINFYLLRTFFSSSW